MAQFRDVPARTQSTRPSLEVTAFGFPTIHAHYPHHDDDKAMVWKQAGVPGQYSGLQHTRVVENEKLVGKEHHLISVIKSYMGKNQIKRMAKIKDAKQRVAGRNVSKGVVQRTDDDSSKPTSPVQNSM